MCFADSGLEEVVLPESVKTVAVCAFKSCKQLRRTKLNEGLEVLGETWINKGKEFKGMVFAASGIEEIRLPSTLKTLEA